MPPKPLASILKEQDQAIRNQLQSLDTHDLKKAPESLLPDQPHDWLIYNHHWKLQNPDPDDRTFCAGDLGCRYSEVSKNIRNLLR